METDILLAIENKIDSPEQKNQVKDYLKHLEFCTGVSGQRYALIYLTPDGRPPDYLDGEELRTEINERRLFCWSYQCQLKEWLEACYRKCEAQKIQFFLSDFIGRSIESHMQRKQTTSAMNTEPIRDYIIKSEQHLQSAKVVSEVWPEARQKIADDFLKRLENWLKNDLKGWESDRDGIIYADNYATFDFWKPTWHDQYCLSLQWGQYGKEMVIGVYREKEKIGTRPFSGDLLEAVRKKFPWASTNWCYEARIKMKNPSSDWSSPEILWQMHSDPKFLEEVVEQLVEVAEISEPIIERLAQNK